MSGPFDFRYKTDIFKRYLSQARNSFTSSSCVSVIPHKLTFYCVHRFIHCDMSSGNSGLTAWCGYPLCWRPGRDLWMTHIGFVVRRDFVSWVPDIFIITSFWYLNVSSGIGLHVGQSETVVTNISNSIFFLDLWLMTLKIFELLDLSIYFVQSFVQTPQEMFSLECARFVSIGLYIEWTILINHVNPNKYNKVYFINIYNINVHLCTSPK